MPTFLLTNDDGIHSDGLHALCHAFAKEGTVYVAAPDREQSASGHAITLHRPLRVQETGMKECGVAGAWAVDGTPADGVKLAIDAPLLPVRPDLVVSGINRGPNLGTDVIYSGTVSAAFEAVLSGIPALAVSLCEPSPEGYELAGEIAVKLASAWLASPLPHDTLLNVNVPAVKPEDLVGIAVARLGRRRYDKVFERRVDPRGRVYFWMAGEPLEDAETGTDIDTVTRNMVAVTPLYFDLTRHDVCEVVGEWLTTARLS